MTSRLPGVLAEISSLVGEAAAVQLAKEKGGLRVYIPARVSDTHWLVLAVGREKAEAICDHFGGGEVDIPLAGTGAYRQMQGRIARQIHQGLLQKKSGRALAREVGVTERTVQNHRAVHGRRKRGDQGTLL